MSDVITEPLYRSFRIVSDDKAVAALEIIKALTSDLTPTQFRAVVAFLVECAKETQQQGGAAMTTLADELERLPVPAVPHVIAMYDAAMLAQAKLEKADKEHRGADWLAVTSPLTEVRNEAWDRFELAFLARAPAIIEALRAQEWRPNTLVGRDGSEQLVWRKGYEPWVGRREDYGVTHWRPLPNPPAQEQGKPSPTPVPSPPQAKEPG